MRMTMQLRTTPTFCKKLASNFKLNLGLGAFSLTVGIAITAFTFQGERNRSVGGVFLIGPIFISTGIMVIFRAMLFQCLKKYSSPQRRRRRHQPRGGEGEYSGATRTETASAANVRYADDPPTYETTVDPPTYETTVATSTSILVASEVRMITTIDNGDESLPPPPSYEEATRHHPVILPEPHTEAAVTR